MDKSSLGDRMKDYEMAEAGRRLMPLVPVLARLDGRAFSNFTRDLERPFDARFSAAMVATTTFLVGQTNARIGYTQSDEITLIWQTETAKQSILFDGRIQKMTSTLAAMASVRFNREVAARIPEAADREPTFDARVWAVPNRLEAVNAVLWRELDAAKNSISMAARAHYAHTALEHKSGAQMQDMLMAKGVNWNDYPTHFKRGSYLQRRTVARKYAPEALAALPEQHHARQDPDLIVERTTVERIEMPPLSRVVNRVEVLFDAAEPQTADEDAFE